jgi:hypothetical protein
VQRRIPSLRGRREWSASRVTIPTIFPQHDVRHYTSCTMYVWPHWPAQHQGYGTPPPPSRRSFLAPRPLSRASVSIPPSPREVRGPGSLRPPSSFPPFLDLGVCLLSSDFRSVAFLTGGLPGNFLLAVEFGL